MPPKRRHAAKKEWEAAMKEKLEVRPSTIKDAGMGLFAKKKIRKDTKIGRYIGKRIFKEESRNLPKERWPYLMKNKKGIYIDGYQLDNFMRWINHSEHVPNVVPVLHNNGTVIVQSIAPIEEGDELFLNYGYDPREYYV